MKTPTAKTFTVVTLVMAMVLLAIAVTACSNNTVQSSGVDNPLPSETSPFETPPPSETPPSNEPESPDRPEKNLTLYNGSSYTVVSNELIDTYFIACGLLFDFEGNYLFNSGMNVDYQQTIEHFSPYSNHPFIHKLEAFVDMENKYADMGVLYYLAQYVISMSNTGLGIGNIQSDSFQSDEDFYAFVDDLIKFYQDTGAKDFFETSKLHESQKQYLSKHMKDVPVDELLREMESYVGNKSDVFGSSNIHYCSLISVYKSPNNATFHTFGMNQDMFLTSIQSPLGFDGNFNVNQLFESYQHEALHMYINQGVERQGQIIDTLSKDKNPSDFASSQYVNMPWHRITDEAIVRAVQARIYDQEILSKEIQAGFRNLDAIYDSLEEYENNRNKYPKIDDYLVNLIECYLN